MSKYKEELKILRERATSMGIEFSPNATQRTLLKKIEEAGGGNVKAVPTDESSVAGTEIDKAPAELSHEEFLKKAMQLKRVIVTPNSPDEVKLHGRWLSVGNRIIPTVTKFIDFNSPDGYHIPSILLDTLKEMKYKASRKVKGKDGKPDSVKFFWAQRYTITELEPLTTKELEELAKSQRARGVSGQLALEG